LCSAASRLDGMIATEKSHFVAFKLKKVVPKPQKNTICGSPNHQKKGSVGSFNGDSGKPPPKSILITICEVFGGVTAPTLSLFSLFYIALFGFI
jgi:hypothetical protein